MIKADLENLEKYGNSENEPRFMCDSMRKKGLNMGIE